MLISASLLIITVIGLFSLILGSNFFGQVIEVSVDNTAIVNGSITTYVVEGQDILFFIDTSVLTTAGIVLLIAIIAVAVITGVQVLSSGLNAESAKIVIIITSYIGIWAVLSVLAFSLIISIQIFGTLIYITLTIAYVVGVAKTITGSGN